MRVAVQNRQKAHMSAASTPPDLALPPGILPARVITDFCAKGLIGLERPLQTGDYVTMGSLEGTVRRIGSRCTVIETTDRT